MVVTEAKKTREFRKNRFRDLEISPLESLSMLTKEQIIKKYETIHEHFGFRDFLGLSALVFGLLMSGTTFGPKVEANEMVPTVEVEATTPSQPEPTKPRKKAHKKSTSQNGKSAGKKPRSKKQRKVSATP